MRFSKQRIEGPAPDHEGDDGEDVRTEGEEGEMEERMAVESEK